MQIIVSKKHILKVSLIFLLLISIILCVYSIWNYGANATLTQNNSFKRERSQWPNTVNQRSEDENPYQHRTPQSGNASASSGNMQQPNGNSSAQSGNMQWPNGNISSPRRNVQNGIISTGGNYAFLLTTYSMIFLILFIAGYYVLVYKNLKVSSGNEKILIFTLLSVGLLLRISLSTLMAGHSFDINIFKNWAVSAANNFSKFYLSSRSSDYPPLYIYILFLIGKIASINTISPYFILLLKLPSIIADIATSYFIYKVARKYLSLEISILLCTFYIFNPATFIDSTFWGQVDSFFTFLVVTAVFLLSEKKIAFSSVLFTAGVLMKPQGIIFLPVLLFELVRERSLKSFVKVIVSALITAVVIILPFSFNQDPLWIFKLFSNTISEYPYASVNAFNFFSLIGANYTKNSAILFLFSYHSWGMIFIVIITAFSWLIYIKGNSRTFAPAAALIQIAGVFTFSVGMHERYLFPAAALALLAFIYLRDKRLLILSVGFSITIYSNIYSILFGTLKGVNSMYSSPVLLVTSLLNVILFVYLAKVLFDIAIKKKTYLLP